ncbi:MAG: ComEC/Rec2 family competence protein [Clostridia bacterium]|nr:ComEC/Rec2 family competence protein [Clostridia bacterium]
MIDYLKERPMLVSAVGCIVSAFCGFYCKVALMVCFALFTGLFLLVVIKKNYPLAVAFLLTLVMTVSCFLTLNRINELNKYSDSVITADICVLGTTFKSDSYFITEAEVIKCDSFPKNTKLILFHSPLSLRGGDALRTKIKILKLLDKYKASSYGKNIFLSGEVLELKRQDSADGVLSATEKLKDYIRACLFGNMKYESAATMSALIFGDRSYLTDEFYDNVKASGVAHAMVVSGMHLTIIVGLVLKIIEKFIYNYRLKALIMFMVVLLLCTVCGFTMSILRAGVTYILIAVALLLKRPYSGENALGGAVTFISIASPFAIFSIAFQLSLLSTFGILAVAMPIYKRLKKKITNKIFCYFAQLVTISLSATIMVLPVMIYVFGYVSVVSVLTNLLIDFPLSYCLCGGVIAVIIKPVFPFTASILLDATDLGIRYINGAINFIGGQKFATVRVDEKGVYISVALIFVIFKIMLICKSRQDMLKLKLMNEKILSERGSKTKWQSFLRSP